MCIILTFIGNMFLQKCGGRISPGLGAVFPGLGADLPGGCFLSMVYIIFSHVRCDPLI